MLSYEEVYFLKNEYYEYLKREIGSLDKMTISQFGIALKGLVGKSEHDQCLTWDIKAMALANHFIVFNEDTRLVNQYEYGNEKYPDIDSFSEEQLEFYKELITNCYSHEIIARYCNILVQCSKDGYKFVDRAIYEMQLIVIDSNLSEQRSYLSRILWLAIRYNKQEIIQYVIENLKNRIFAIIASESEIIYLPWNISQYIKAVFVKGSVGEKNDEINKIVEHCKKEAKACDTSYEMTAKQIFENLIIISRKIKDEMLCCELLKAYIDYEITIGDALMKKNEYPRAAESYEQAVSLCNKNGMLSRVNEALIGLRKANVELGESIEPTVFNVPIPNSEQIEEEISQFMSGDPAADFRRFVAFFLSNIVNNTKSLFPRKAESLKKAKKRINENCFWNFTGIVKMSSDRKIAEATTKEENENYLMYDDYVQHIKIMTAIWFEPVIENLKDEGLSQQIVSSLLLGAEWLSETNKILVEESIRMLFDKNYIAFMHIAIPTYESIFRRLFGFHDLATTHLDMKDGSQKEKIFGEFLKSEMVKNNLPAIIVEMSEIIFTDQLGLNLRNNIAHGLCEKEDFNKNTSYIVFQMLIIITCFDWIANKGIEIQN